jgi:magnesium-transporting ATPase (P-type)
MENLFLQSLCCNSSAELFPEKLGSSTEIALLEYIEKTGTKYHQYREQYHVI